ncbi:hypothetical protein [Pseudoalteromonas sp. H105]|uniref:hypothetical protein n=1 Tax=Pseudoalteromonas sp. H105 TaxID=1348393 RepID=UPI00073235E0|nr:hypothetical protein [Pseudoalteromonas sp. H105]KTF08651.1 hypothetical protein ATS75_19910 [Pseudoalteromonas sp. H105]
MVEAFFIFILIYVAFALLAWINAKSRGALYWSDLCPPVVLPLFWVAVTSSGYGHQSLSHIVEVPIVLILSVLFLNIRVFVVDRYKKNYKVNSYVVLGLGLILVLSLRTFMPYLPQ